MRPRDRNMDSKTFLADLDLRPLTLADAGALKPLGLMIGPGSGGLEIAIVHSDRKPTQDALRSAWKSREGVGRRGRIETGDT